MDWGLCSSKQGKSVDGPSGGEGESRGRKQKAGCSGLTAKGRNWEVRKGEKQRRDAGCLVLLMIAIVIISNIDQI